jgi:hypothetical protein
VPPLRGEAGDDVLGARQRGVALDLDVVVVVDDDEVVEAMTPRECTGLGGHPLLEVPVGGQDPDGAVEHGRPGCGVGVE